MIRQKMPDAQRSTFQAVILSEAENLESVVLHGMKPQSEMFRFAQRDRHCACSAGR